jgi:two-component system, NarL family, response regulator YdfI
VIRVLIAARSTIARTGLEALLATQATLVAVGSAPDIVSFMPQVEDLQPDVVLVELEAFDDETLANLQALNASSRPPACVVLTDDGPEGWVAEVLRAGIRAILPRQASGSEIVAAVEAAATGLVVLHRDLVDSLLPAVSPHTRDLPAPAQQALTPREIEVLGMIAEGVGNKTIAWRLGISEHTVKFHVGSIFAKLNASSRTEAVTLGIRQGLILL